MGFIHLYCTQILLSSEVPLFIKVTGEPLINPMLNLGRGVYKGPCYISFLLPGSRANRPLPPEPKDGFQPGQFNTFFEAAAYGWTPPPKPLDE